MTKTAPRDLYTDACKTLNITSTSSYRKANYDLIRFLFVAVNTLQEELAQVKEELKHD